MDDDFRGPASSKKPAKKISLAKVPFVLVLVGVLVIGFAGGVLFQKHDTKRSVTVTSAGSQQGGFGRAGGFQRGNRAIGTVSAVSSTSITINNQRTGASSTYTITSSTTVTNSGQSASVSDIQVGSTVFITLDSSNAQDASSIVLNPSFGGGAGASGTSSPDSSSNLPTSGT